MIRQPSWLNQRFIRLSYRRPHRLCLFFTAITLSLLLADPLFRHFRTTHDLPQRHRIAYANSVWYDWGKLFRTPRWGHAYYQSKWGPIELIQELRQGVWPGSWAVPDLVICPPVVEGQDYRDGKEKVSDVDGGPGAWAADGDGQSIRNETNETPAWVMIHIFSTPSHGSRLRREAIRAHHPLHTVPEAYRHLFEFKFILGRYPIDGKSKVEIQEIEEEERRIRIEQERNGDIIRLDGLKDGENMDEGKTWEWIRWAGRDGGREAQWVFKCDDDTFPLLPNLLPILLQLDPAQPTYLGTSLNANRVHAYYHEGMMYGFSWGVLKTLATAAAPLETIREWHIEDAYVGQLMHNLPSVSSPQPHPQGSIKNTAHGLHVIPFTDQGPSPSTLSHRELSNIYRSIDLRTGLLRVNLGTRLGKFSRWYVARGDRAVGWHGLKSDEDWPQVWGYAVREFRKWSRDFMWIPPREWECDDA